MDDLTEDSESESGSEPEPESESESEYESKEEKEETMYLSAHGEAPPPRVSRRFTQMTLDMSLRRKRKRRCLRLKTSVWA